MFFSLNKKIILSIAIFFISTFCVFGYTLYNIYNTKLQEDRQFLQLKNKQYNELLYKYYKLQSEIKNTTITPPTDTLKDNKYEWIQQEFFKDTNLHKNIYLILSCLITFSIFIIIMILLLHTLILVPIKHFNNMNNIIRKGIYNQRLNLPKKLLNDEFSYLEQTYNQMLDNIEEQVQHIKQQHKFLQNILNGIPDAIRVLDFNGNIILTNETYNKTLEHLPTISKAKCYQSLLERKTPCQDILNCPLHILDKQQKIKFIHQLPSGNKQYLSVSAARIDSTNQPLIIESFRDLSENIKFSHQQKISGLGFLTTAIAHEIKNNLGSMRLIMESLLKSKFSSSELKKYNELLYNQLLECIKIPERLLKMARSSNAENDQVNCNECIREICALLDYNATYNGIKIELDTQDTLPNITCNETDFKMIILNLAQNAIKAMSSGGTLKIETKHNSHNILINISDTGCGIPKDQLPHIFEPFFSNNKNNDEHIGLGLAIVKSLLNNLGGSISVKSKSNKGACFSLKIPYKNKK